MTIDWRWFKLFNIMLYSTGDVAEAKGRAARLLRAKIRIDKCA